MNRSGILEQGRDAFRRKEWATACELLSAVYNESHPEPGDLEQLATASYLTGTDCIETWSLAHQEYLNKNNPAKAAYCAFWAGMILFNQGEAAQGGGWITRANRLMIEYKQHCAEKGFLLIPEALEHLRNKEADKAFELFKKAGNIGVQFSNMDLLTLSRLGRGQTFIHQERFAEGRKLMDEAMVAVVAEEASPIVAGIVYCAVIDTCRKIYDLNRAREWTSAFSRWCDTQPDLIPYRGQCLVRRAEIMQMHGEWPEAMAEVQKASELAHISSPPAAGDTMYCKAELLRLQGYFLKAEEAYRQTNHLGRKPQPGLALLRLAQDKKEAAASFIRTVEKESRNPLNRSRILPAFIEIMLEMDDTSAAEPAVRELTLIADEFQSPYLQAIAARAQGHLFLVNDSPRQALDKLLYAWSLLKRMKASYESARTRVLIGLTYLELNDKETAEMELDAARWVFQRIHASHDFALVDLLLSQQSKKRDPFDLTPRENEVLCCLATGKTNREIASDLFISKRTVDRHVSNILAKLNLPSRAAATAFAFEHKII